MCDSKFSEGLSSLNEDFYQFEKRVGMKKSENDEVDKNAGETVWFNFLFITLILQLMQVSVQIKFWSVFFPGTP